MLFLPSYHPTILPSYHPTILPSYLLTFLPSYHLYPQAGQFKSYIAMTLAITYTARLWTIVSLPFQAQWQF